jgi:hypothetical protein
MQGTAKSNGNVLAGKPPNRKKRRAKLQAPGRRVVLVEPEPSSTEQIYQALRESREHDRLLAILCSPWWAWWVVYRNGAYLPNTACTCRKCRGERKFPNYYSGWRPIQPNRADVSKWMSYECWLAKHEPAEGDSQPISEAEARDRGLHVAPSGRLWNSRTGLRRGREIVVMRVCENCDEKARIGRVYCQACEQSVRATLVEDGWAPSRIEKWVRGDESALED